MAEVLVLVVVVMAVEMLPISYFLDYSPSPALCSPEKLLIRQMSHSAFDVRIGFMLQIVTLGNSKFA